MNVFTFTREGAHCVRSKPNCIILSVDLGWEGQLSFSYVLGGSTRDWSWRELLDVETWYSVEIKQHFSRDKVTTRYFCYCKLQLLQYWFEILVEGRKVHEKLVPEPEFYEEVEMFGSVDSEAEGGGCVFVEEVTLSRTEGPQGSGAVMVGRPEETQEEGSIGIEWEHHWSQWSTCSADCTRVRTKSEKQTQEVPCQPGEGNCPREWTEWSECSKTCKKERSRGNDVDRDVCQPGEGQCPHQWTEWSECSKTCKKERFRGKERDEGICRYGEGQCPHQWTEWSVCSKSCKKERLRGTERDEGKCQHGSGHCFMSWSSWSECGEDCIRRRFRGEERVQEYCMVEGDQCDCKNT